MSHFLISAAHKSSGKTTLSIGICAELRRQGVRVQPFKKGPDYIDPLWLSQAAGRPCHNLDFYTQSQDEIRHNFASRIQGADIALIEGNKGLYDGLDLEGGNSNAALAGMLEAPVVLVLDTRGTTRGVAPLLLGYQAFGPDIRIAGVILNQVGGARHERKLRQVVEHYTDLKIVGAVQRADSLAIVERHLGLMPSNESAASAAQIESIRATIADQVDFDLLRSIAADAPCVTDPGPVMKVAGQAIGRGLRIGIAMDEAFGFYYPGDLDALEREGAELVPFSPMNDQVLPVVEGIFIGGGFPEVRMQELEANVAMRAAVREYVEAGRPLYAECGGLMYLARSLSWGEKSCKMVGVVEADAVMYPRPQGRGYVRLQQTEEYPWGESDGLEEIAAHEFHYSRLENLPPDPIYAFKVLRGTGIDGDHDGILYKNMLANYTHLRHVQGYPWTRKFLEHVRRVAEQTRHK